MASRTKLKAQRTICNSEEFCENTARWQVGNLLCCTNHLTTSIRRGVEKEEADYISNAGRMPHVPVSVDVSIMES